LERADPPVTVTKLVLVVVEGAAVIVMVDELVAVL